MNAGRPLGALSVSGPSMRVTRERLAGAWALVRSVADELTQALGGKPCLTVAAPLNANAYVAAEGFPPAERRSRSRGGVRCRPSSS